MPLSVHRWFDKSFSLIVLKNGVSGLNFEHSWGDGVAVLRYFEDIYKDSTLKPHIHPDTKPSSQNAERLVTPLSEYILLTMKIFCGTHKKSIRLSLIVIKEEFGSTLPSRTICMVGTINLCKKSTLP